MSVLVENYTTAVSNCLDDSKLVHYLLFDENLKIRHISRSFARICNGKYFDLLHLHIKQLPLFVKETKSNYVQFQDSALYTDIQNGSFTANNFWFKTVLEEKVYLNVCLQSVEVENQNLKLIILTDQELSASFFKKSELYDSFFESSSEAIMITDASTNILSVNSAFSHITGYSEDDVLGATPRILQSGYHNQAFYEKLWGRLIATGRWSGKLVNRRKSGDLFSEKSTIRAIRDYEGNIVNFLSIFSELTSANPKDIADNRLSLKHDELTALPKRAVLEDRANQAVMYAARHKLSVIAYYFNIDNFSEVNENYDVKKGDLLIKAIVKTVNRNIREEDTFARIFGDEFSLILRDVPRTFDADEFSVRLQKMIRSAAEELDIGVNLSASIGMSEFPEDDVTGRKLIRHANHAMNIAKSEGGGCIVHYSTEKQLSKVQARKDKTEVMLALEKNQMQLYLQPQVDLETKKLKGIEFLIRWLKENDKVVYPDDFLNKQRDRELLLAVDKWVIMRSLEIMGTDLYPLIQQGIRVGVNLTPCSLQDGDFHDWLYGLLRDINPELVKCIEIEILENDALKNIDQLRNLIDHLKPLGVHFSLDDFGTGYSSLSIFNQLEVDTVKIDKSFVRNMVVDHKNLSLVKAICNMSSIFEREIIAEGVEYREQAELLQLSGCNIMQGFGIAEPMPLSQFNEWVKTQSFSESW